MIYGTEGQRAAMESARTAELREILDMWRRFPGSSSFASWYVVNMATGEVVAAAGGLVAVDFDALDQHDRDIFESGSAAEVADMAARVGFTLDVMLGGES